MALIIETGRLRQQPEKLRGTEPAAFLEFAPGDDFRPDGDLAYDLTVQCVSGELIVLGTLKINLVCRCARCGDDFSKKMVISDFCRSFPLTSKNELINLTPDMREDILLALPMVAVCSGECRGLCSGCGINLNRKKCKCKRPEKNVWGVLDGLRVSRETRDKQ